MTELLEEFRTRAEADRAELRAEVSRLGEQLAEAQRAHLDEVAELVRRYAEAAAATPAEPPPTLPPELVQLPAAVSAFQREVGEERARQEVRLAEVANLRGLVEAQSRHQAQIAEVVRGVRAELAALRERSTLTTAVPPSIADLPQAMTSLGARLAESQEQAHAVLHAELTGLRELIRRPVEPPPALVAVSDEIARAAEAMRAAVAEMRELLARPSALQAPSELNGRAADLVEAVAHDLKAEIDVVREAIASRAQLLDQLVHDPDALEALNSQLHVEQLGNQAQLEQATRAGEARIEGVVQAQYQLLLGVLRAELAEARNVQQSQITSIVTSGNRWFLRAFDVMLERLEKLLAESGSIGGQPLASVEALEGELEGLRGELSVIDESLSGLRNDVKELIAHQAGESRPDRGGTRQP